MHLNVPAISGAVESRNGWRLTRSVIGRELFGGPFKASDPEYDHCGPGWGKRLGRCAPRGAFRVKIPGLAFLIEHRKRGALQGPVYPYRGRSGTHPHCASLLLSCQQRGVFS